MENKYVAWLKNNAEFLRLRRLEERLKIPESTLRKFVAGERPLPPQYIEPIEKWVKKFIKIR